MMGGRTPVFIGPARVEMGMGFECVDMLDAERRRICEGRDPRELEEVRGRRVRWGMEGAKIGVVGKLPSPAGVRTGGEGERDAGRA